MARALTLSIPRRHGTLLEAARSAATSWRAEGLDGLRSWARWQAALGDAPRRGPCAERAGAGAGLHTIRLRSMADVKPCFEEIKELWRREEPYAFFGSPRIVVSGYCLACGWGDLRVTDDYGENTPAWRESAVCRCGLNTRMRSVLDWLVNVERPASDARIYCTEATTSFFSRLKQRQPGAVGSEFIPDRAAPGTTDAAGIRCENVEQLSFADGAFDYVVSLDVLEHVFSYEAALRELWRVLKPGGVAVVTVPFGFDRSTTVRRAEHDGEAVKHLLPPIYHGDPLKKGGVLLVFDYGWDLIDYMHEVGWRDVGFIHLWSEAKKYFGRNFILRAVKPAPPEPGRG